MHVLRFEREGATQLVEALREWTPRDGHLTTLHAGDVGWHLRLDDADLRGTLVAVVDGGETVEVGILDGSSNRSTVKPTRLQDRVVADALVSVVVERPPADIADRVRSDRRLRPVDLHRRPLAAALARAGASGVTVCTPAYSTAAVRSYEACGMRQVELLHDLRRPAESDVAPGG